MPHADREDAKSRLAGSVIYKSITWFDVESEAYGRPPSCVRIRQNGRCLGSSCALTAAVMDDNSASATPARRDRTAMPTRVHRHPLTVLFSWLWPSRHVRAGIADYDSDQRHDRRGAMHGGAARQNPRLRCGSGTLHDGAAKTTSALPLFRVRRGRLMHRTRSGWIPARSVLIKTVLY